MGRYHTAMECLRVSTHCPDLKSSLATFALRFLFDKLDVKNKGCVSFAQISQALVVLRLPSTVDAKRAAYHLFPSIVSDQVVVFVHLAFDSEVQKKGKLDSETIAQALCELRLAKSAALIESVLNLCSQGGPDELIHFEAFDDFFQKHPSMSFQITSTFLRGHGLLDDSMTQSIQERVAWLSAEDKLSRLDDVGLLKQVVEACRNLTGSRGLDEARVIISAAHSLVLERKRQSMQELLKVCGHLKESGCETSIACAKRLLAFDDRLESVSNIVQLRYLVHACRDLQSESVSRGRQLIALHTKLERHVLGISGMSDRSDYTSVLPKDCYREVSSHGPAIQESEIQRVVTAFDKANVEASTLMCLMELRTRLVASIYTLKKLEAGESIEATADEAKTAHPDEALLHEARTHDAKAHETAHLNNAPLMMQHLIATLLQISSKCPPAVAVQSDCAYHFIVRSKALSWRDDLNTNSPLSLYTDAPTDASTVKEESEASHATQVPGASIWTPAVAAPFDVTPDDEREQSAAIKIQSRARGNMARRRPRQLAREGSEIGDLIAALEALQQQLLSLCHDLCSKEKESKGEHWVGWGVALHEHALLNYWKLQLQDFLAGYACAPDFRILDHCTKLFVQRAYWSDVVETVCNLFYLAARIEKESVNALVQDLTSLHAQATSSLQCSPAILLKIQAYVWLIECNNTAIAKAKRSLLYVCLKSLVTSVDPDHSESSFNSGHHVFVPTPRVATDWQDDADWDQDGDPDAISPLGHSTESVGESGLQNQNSSESLTSIGSRGSRQSKLSLQSNVSRSSRLNMRAGTTLDSPSMLARGNVASF